MTNKEAIEVLETMTMSFTSRRNGKTMLALKYAEAVAVAIKALRENDDLKERAYGHVVGQGTKGVIRDYVTEAFLETLKNDEDDDEEA